MLTHLKLHTLHDAAVVRVACSIDGKMTNTFDSSKEVKTTAVDYTELRAGISSVKQLRVLTSPISPSLPLLLLLLLSLASVNL